MEEDKRQTRWDPNVVGAKLMIDVGSAAMATALVAPLVTVIDKYACCEETNNAEKNHAEQHDRAVPKRVSSRMSFLASLRKSLKHLVFRPHTFLFARPTRIMMLLYGSTYLTANTIDTMSSTVQDQPASTTTTGFLKFGAVSLVNLSLALYKDSQFTKMFGIISPRPLPPASYALLALRDSLTIFASFNLPPKLAPLLPQSVEDHFSRLTVAQFIAPALAQTINTPLHLLGLDLYNRNNTMPVKDRLKKVRLDWPVTSLARMCRVLPAFGVGVVVNNKLRASMMSNLDQSRTTSIKYKLRV
ncbi:MAG: hypothetical protein Q9195_008787 [Heterodermia aff. obscurata]